MEILPVIDLMRGQVVRGVAGDRASYAPIQSRLCEGSTPAGVAASFARAGFQRVYVADLDAIGGHGSDWSAYQAISDAGLRMWLDAGLGSEDRAQRFLLDAAARFPSSTTALDGVIVGLESIASPGQLPRMAERLGTRAVFSLDLKQGRLLTNVDAWRACSPLEVAAEAVEAGFLRLIVLDLARVGLDQGLSVEPLCAAIASRWPHLELVSGGGVRNQADLARLSAAGCSAALVASALHDGRLPVGNDDDPGEAEAPTFG